MSVVSFDPREHISRLKPAVRRPIDYRRSLRERWRSLPLGLRDGLLIFAALAGLLTFSILAHRLLG